jgi:four helix bundle protein
LFALRIIRLVESLPETKTAKTIGSQIIHSGTSVGASYQLVEQNQPQIL